MSESTSPLRLEDLNVRDMRSQDLRQVLVLERNAHINPWSRLSFEESLTKGSVCRVIEHHDDIVAFHVGNGVLDEFHILNVLAAKHLQGLGLGHCLMQDILQQASDAGALKVFLEVRRSNTIAQSLYRKWQFKQIAVRKRYYRNPTQGDNSREDALVFVRAVSE